jgi:predicted transcriptional regulator
MTDLMEQAIDALRQTPLDQQDNLARLVMQLAGHAHPIYVLSREEEAAIAEADAEIARGEFATDSEMNAIWAKYTL